MATRINLHPDMVRRAVEMLTASAQRQLNSKTLNPKFKAIHEEDIRQCMAGLAEISEVK